MSWNSLTNARWESFNQEHYVKPKSKSELGQEGHWLIDSQDPAGYKIVVGNVPPIPRFVLLHAFAGRYARACAARWGCEVEIKPLPAQCIDSFHGSFVRRRLRP